MLNIVEPPCANVCVVSDRDRLLGSWCYDISLFLNSCKGILLPYNISITLKLKGHIKRKVNLKNLKFVKKSIEPFKNHSPIC